LLSQTAERGRLVFAISLVAMLWTGLAADTIDNFTLFRVDAIVIAAAVHFLITTYRRVRAEEEKIVRDYRPFAVPTVVAEPTAEQVSVGVRLNAL